MVKLFLFVFATIGMSHILVDSKLFSWVKEWKIWSRINCLTYGLFRWVQDILACYQCSGWYVGMFVALFTLTGPAPVFLLDLGFSKFWSFIIANIPFVFLGGCAGSFLSYTAALLLSYIVAKT